MLILEWFSVVKWLFTTKSLFFNEFLRGLLDLRGKTIIMRCLHAVLKHNLSPDFLRTYQCMRGTVEHKDKDLLATNVELTDSFILNFSP